MKPTKIEKERGRTKMDAKYKDGMWMCSSCEIKYDTEEDAEACCTAEEKLINAQHQIKQLEEDYKALQQENARLKSEIEAKDLLLKGKDLTNSIFKTDIKELRQALEEIKHNVWLINQLL